MDFFAWYLGLADPADSSSAGAAMAPGVEMRLTARSPWGWLLGDRVPALLVWLAVGVALFFVARTIGRQSAELTTGRRSILVGLRLASLLLILGLLTLPAIAVRKVGLPILPILIDTSGSMSIVDVDSNSLGSAASPVAGGSTKPIVISRLAAAQKALTSDDGQLLRRLGESFDIRLYEFSEEVKRLGTRDDQRRKVEQLQPEGLVSRMGPAVVGLLEGLRGSPVAGVIVLTDGVPNPASGDQLSFAIGPLAARGIPLFPISVGSTREPVDVELAEFLTDDVAFQGDPMLVSARIRTSGLPSGTVKIELKDSSNGTVLATQEVLTSGSGKPVPVELSWTPEKPGDYQLVLEVEGVADESNLDNNRQSRLVKVRGDKLRVLLVESVPRYEFRFLKQFLERDQSIELQTLLQEADLDYAKEDRTAIRNFPIRKEDFDAIDVVILGDVDPSLLSPSSLELLDDFVRNQGGGLISIAGEMNNPWKWGGTSLERLLPFRVADASRPAKADEPFQPALTVEGSRGSKLFRFAPMPAENQVVWNDLAPWLWAVRIDALKPGAMVFAERREAGQRMGEPLIILQRVGNGKVLYQASDETWRWRFRIGDSVFGKYWVQAIRFMSRNRGGENLEPVRFTADRSQYEVGEAIHLQLDVLDERVLPAETKTIKVEVEAASGKRQAVELRRVGQAELNFQAELTGLGEGAYSIRLADPQLLASVKPIQLVVTAAQRELLAKSVNAADMELAARATRGAYLPIEKLAELPERLPKVRAMPVEADRIVRLWNRWEVLVLLVGLVCLEWCLLRAWRLI
ncbi:MAG: hypothetical protein C0478_16680 [Planctomyces sp.]|nr:hypothetical protein [Planctomyces sp.]